MAYTVLARRYRSQTFDDVVGQDAIAQTLKNAIKTGRVAHAYLFCGTRGVGKTTMARILAKGLNCLKADAPTTTPCCECEACVSINTGEDIDVIEIDGASNNGVDNIRELRNNAIFRPARSRYKVYIIDEIHMLSTGAFNALLKILEEPPAHVKFIFATTEPNKVLPTIQSRCQRFDFRAIDAAGIGKQLKSVLGSEQLAYEEDFITSVSRQANGSMRDALSLLDQVISTGIEPLTLEVLEATLGQPGRGQIASLLTCVADKDAAGALTITDNLLTEGMSCLQISDALVEYMRDVMVASTAGSESSLMVLTSAERKAVAELVSKFDLPALIYGVTAFEKMRGIIKNSENSRAILEASIVRLALSENFISVQSLMQRLGKADMTVKKKSFEKLTPDAGNANVSAPPIRAGRNVSQTPEKNTSLPVIPCSSLEQVVSNWQSISSAVNSSEPMIANLLSGGKPVALNNSSLQLQFPQNSMSIKLLADQSRMKRLCSLLSTIISMPIKVEVTAGSDDRELTHKPKGARTSSKERQEVLNNPGVKTILKAFNAKVMDISISE
jgi:DNA polymerase III subunit gamma/tau